jgi:hypothetical protein
MNVPNKFVLHYTGLERLATDKQSCLLGQFVSNKENGVFLKTAFGFNLIKHFWSKFTQSFSKLIVYIHKMVLLTKIMSKSMPK